MTDSNDFRRAIAELKLAHNIVDYITQSGINLKQNGVNKWKGLCPFHNERTPSFIVNENFQNYRCFGCGESGDIISFVEKNEHLDFYSAVKKLAEDKNIVFNIGNENKSKVDYTSLRGIMKETANFFYKEYRKLDVNHPARKEIINRGLNEKNMLYGYAPEGRQTLYKFLKSKGYSDEKILESGVCIKFENNNTGLFDFWHGRLMFFITDITGKPIGFSGRKLYDTDKRGKYVNSQDGPLFNKSNVLFNIDKAKKMASETKTIYVTEGQFDVASFIEAGLTNVVASSGTAFTENQAMIARRLVTENGKIIFSFDGDEAGVKAALKVFETVPMIHNQTYVVKFPEGTDPCDYRQDNSNEKLIEYVENNAKSIVEFVLDHVANQYDFDSEMGRSQYVENASQVLANVSSKILQETFLKKVALTAFVNIDTVRNNVEKYRKNNSNKKQSVMRKETESTVTVSERPVFAEKDYTSIIELINTNETYNLAARLINFTLIDRDFSIALGKSITIIPDELKRIVTELTNLPEGNIVPEQFTDHELVEFILKKNYFSLSHLMEKADRQQHFQYIFNRLKSVERNRLTRNVKSKIARILEESDHNDASFFAEAIEREQEELLKLREKS